MEVTSGLATAGAAGAPRSSRSQTIDGVSRSDPNADTAVGATGGRPGRAFFAGPAAPSTEGQDFPTAGEGTPLGGLPRGGAAWEGAVAVAVAGVPLADTF